jgi:DNA-directed RNA polymerase beta subunit
VPERLDPEDAWTVINSFFADKGLVRQQLESFNEFVENSMQEIVEERGKLVLDQYPQFNNEDDTVMVRCFISLLDSARKRGAQSCRC